jgi:hypothetical protein
VSARQQLAAACAAAGYSTDTLQALAQMTVPAVGPDGRLADRHLRTMLDAVSVCAHDAGLRDVDVRALAQQTIAGTPPDQDPRQRFWQRVLQRVQPAPAHQQLAA